MVTLDLARAIAAGRTLGERQTRLSGVPAQFLALVGKVASLMIAGEIARLSGLAVRRAALDHVPAELRGMVEEHLRREFLARAELRRIEAKREAGAVQDDLFVA